ncbi:MAG: DNA-binding response regulator [Chloroflexi bacterium HGW-Chloroflexi-8]|jgi:NarL family two-component system response regulator LiaR|nr:MAG: DNA-binding response regulator [Chloroflexi bacterium HGW-Chloroflexi-8]
MSPKMIRVLVVDDHPIVRRGLITEINLNPEMQVVGEAINGLEAIDLAEKLDPDVILMDIVMPEMDGILATQAILLKKPDSKILILTSFTEEEKIFSAISSGASGFIYKDQHPAKVLEAIKDVFMDIPVLNPAFTRKMMREFQHPKQEDLKTELTDRELEILKMVAMGKPYKIIANDLGLRQATIRAHVSNILSKLNFSNRSQLVLYAVRNKLIEPE